MENSSDYGKRDTAGQPVFCARLTYLPRRSAHGEVFCPGGGGANGARTATEPRRGSISTLSSLCQLAEIVTSGEAAAANPRSVMALPVIHRRQPHIIATSHRLVGQATL